MSPPPHPHRHPGTGHGAGDLGHTHDVAPFEELPRRPGRRLTRPRRLIWAALTAGPDLHLTADEIVGRVPDVDRSTVYRTLETLVADGLALRTELASGRTTYEPAHEHPHHHLVCGACGTVAHVHGDVLGDLPARLDAQTGYLVGRTELTLVGLCPACRAD